MKLLVIDGPNINLLGIREPDIYGEESYLDLLTLLDQTGTRLRVQVDHYQSNHEGNIIDRIQMALGEYDGILINAGAYTHTSLAIADALRAVGLPVVEVHITDTSKREDFRKINFISPLAIKTFQGYGIQSYRKGLEYLKSYIKEKENK